MLADRENRHNVRMVELRDGLRLALKPLAAFGVEEPVARDDLQRDVAAERLLDRLVDDPHAAAAQLADDPVLAQPIGEGLWSYSRFRTRPPTDRLSCSIIATEGSSSRILRACSG